LENERKNQIIKAAVKRFSKHGLGKTTLDEIARDLRIGKATIYHYFTSKEELFYGAIEWESDQYLEDVKLIFENNEITLKEKFNSYFTDKESIDQKYKLLYEIFLILMKDEIFDREKEILKTMLRKEEIILEMALNPVQRKKEMKIRSSLPGLFVLSSWGWAFGMKLNQVINYDDELTSKDSLNILIENMLPD
jgi:predicted transcriptional regulator